MESSISLVKQEDRVPAMRAVIHHRFSANDGLALTEVAKPEAGRDEVLVKVCAAAVNKGDWHIQTGKPYILRLAGYGVSRPRNPDFGQEFAGVVEAVGSRVSTFGPGDEVFGETSGGAFAEYVCAPASEIARKPAAVTFEQAAAIPSSALTALQGLRDHGRIEPGQNVLINGASGGVGTFAVQLAKHFGAEVTGICSTGNTELVRSLGADQVIDYTKEDFTQEAGRYDLFFDLVGNRSLVECRNVLRPRGTYVGCAGEGGQWLGPIGRMIGMAMISIVGSNRLVSFVAQRNPVDLAYIAELVAVGTVGPVIGLRCRLSEAPAALSHQGKGHARGKTVIGLEPG